MFKKKSASFWLGAVAVAFMAAEGVLLLWEPVLPQGMFAGVSTIIGVASKVTQYAVSARNQADLLDDGVINDSV
ncbi:holin [Pseudomonas phage vB_PseuGesM_254]|uniref:Holin n=1 Tax=Pseudomonas phage vB_PseuGesM_254 TaxID=3092638 RepID=A0AAX4G6F7_9CAUD|nr:holin [Pseudomonas phage PseuGes_254]